MTVLSERSDPPTELEPLADTRPDVGPPHVVGGIEASVPPRSFGSLAVGWAIITVVGVVAVLVSMGPVTEQRDQRALLEDQRVAIESASNEQFGITLTEAVPRAPTPGSPVGILDLEAIGLRRVVVEGTTPEQTRRGPGHVVGTAGLGQPGNAVVVGRRSLFGGSFGRIGDLEEGDRILVTTVQGPSVYEVVHVGTHSIQEEATDEEEDLESTPTTLDLFADVEIGDLEEGDPATLDGAAGEEDGEEVLPSGAVTVDQLYGPADDDRLTLVTSASGLPWSDEEAQVVVATMDGVPFEPTAQGGRTDGADGRTGGSDALAPLVLAVVLYLFAVVGAVLLHRRVPWRSAYLLSVPVLLAATVVLGEQLALALPAWS